MNEKISFGYIVAAVTICAVAVFVWAAVDTFAYTPGSEEDASSLSAAPISSLPVRLQIPAVGIDAGIQYVGVTAKGNMAVPSNSIDVAWYKYGTVPGQRGSAVMDGHVDNGFVLPGVFRNLKDINVGEDIYVLTEDGTRLRFLITEIYTYHYKDVPMDVIFNRDDAARLNLITCTGAYITSEKTYDHRLVVFAQLQKS